MSAVKCGSLTVHRPAPLGPIIRYMLTENSNKKARLFTNRKLENESFKNPVTMTIKLSGTSLTKQDKDPGKTSTVKTA